MNYSKFHVVTVISNPVNYKSRYENFKRFEESMLRKGVELWVVELATGARQHAVTDTGNLHHIQLWQTAIEGEVWHKEQLINIGFHHVLQKASDARYLMYSDADILFESDMLEKTIQSLQTFPIVQAWSQMHTLDAKGHTIGTFKSSMYCRTTGDHAPIHPGYPPRIGSPGGAWAFRREILNEMGSALSGPLCDFGICGSGDTYFLNAILGQIDKSCQKGFHPNYNKWLMRYGENVDYVVRRNVGYVPNTTRHLWHGSHESRGYEWRDRILIDNQFNPETDLTKDASGLWRLVIRTPRQMKMRDDLRRYFRHREEDTLI